MTQKLSRQADGFPKNEEGRAGIQVRLNVDPFSQHDPWQRSHPLAAMLITHVYECRLDRIFDSLVAPLQSSVSGGMVGGSEGHLYIEGGHDVLVEVGYKRIAVVTHRQIWTAIPARPLQEGAAALG